MTTFKQVKRKMIKAFDIYCEEVKGEMVEGAPRMFDVLKASVKVTKLSGHSARIGVDMGYLLSNQYNVKKIDYASLVIRGHNDSPWVKLTREPKYVKFPKVEPRPFIEEGVEAVKFVDVYKKS